MPEDIQRAREQGATDTEIHDTVLIAAAFCMYNRYVDGLGTWQPRNPDMYTQMGKHLAEEAARTALGERRFDGDLLVAEQDEVLEPFEVLRA